MYRMVNSHHSPCFRSAKVKSQSGFQLSEITSLFDLSRYLDQNLDSAKVSAKVQIIKWSRPMSALCLYRCSFVLYVNHSPRCHFVLHIMSYIVDCGLWVTFWGCALLHLFIVVSFLCSWYMMDKYTILLRIGEGAHGVVYKAKHIESGEVVALKKVFSLLYIINLKKKLKFD